MPEINFGVRTPLRIVRVKIDDGKTIRDVKQQVAADISVDTAKLTISLVPSGDAPIPDTAKLSTLSIAGKLLYGVVPKSIDLVGAAYGSASAVSNGTAAATTTVSTSTTASPAKPARVLTDRCAHGPHGACPHCSGATDEEIRSMKSGPLNKTTVSRHAEKSAKTADELSGEMEWLCRHRADQMCVNCAPLHKGDTVPLEMLCQHGADARCINCLPPDTTIEGRKYLTYDEWLERARDKCSHPFSAVCVNCAPPSEVKYKMKELCDRHRPWPAGICLECAPATVDLAQQQYRHIDLIAVNAAMDVKALVDLISANARYNLQRAGILYGRYAPDLNYRHGQRAVVDAIYEPPQSWDPATGAVKILPDPNGEVVDKIAATLGLVQVGWVFTRKTTRETHKVELLPHEVYAMGAQQLKHSPRPDGRAGSQFVTLTVFKGTDDQYHLQGYMATDQFMAIVRDNVITLPKASDNMMKRRQTDKEAGERPVPEIIVKDQLRGASRKEEFDPDACIVSIEAVAGSPVTPSSSLASGVTPALVAAAAEKSAPVFKHPGDFPPANREAFGITQDASALKRLLSCYKSEPYQHRLSNFHALVYLARMLDLESAILAARSVSQDKPMPDGLLAILESL